MADQQNFEPTSTTLENLSLKNTQVKYEAIPRPVYHRVWTTANRLSGDYVDGIFCSILAFEGSRDKAG